VKDVFDPGDDIRAAKQGAAGEEVRQRAGV
jgi:hypothetical protein